MKAATNLIAVSGSPHMIYMTCKEVNDFLPGMESLLPDWYGYEEKGAFKVIGGYTNACVRVILISLEPCLYYSDRTIWGYKADSKETFERAWSCLTRHDFSLFRKGVVMSPSDFSRSSYLLGMISSGSSTGDDSISKMLNSSMKSLATHLSKTNSTKGKYLGGNTQAALTP